MIKQGIISILMLVSCSAFAQHIRPLKDVSEEPEPEEHRQLAEKLIQEQRYYAALEHFSKIKAEGLLTLDDMMRMGQAQYELRQYKEAVEVYTAVIASDAQAKPLAHYWLGYLYKALEQYDQSHASFDYFVNNHSSQYTLEAREAYKEIEGLKNALKIKQKDGDAQVIRWTTNGFDRQNISSAIQRGTEDVWFTGATPVKYNRKIEVTKDLVVMIDEIQVSRVYSTASGSARMLDISLPEASVNVSSPSWGKDKTTVYFSACDQFATDISCNIYVTRKRSGKWTPPEKLNERINQFNYSSKNPNRVTAADGKELFFFSSDRPGGYGGYDIWVSEVKDGQFQRPVNLGAGVNTDKDEVTPFFDVNTGYLFMSSNGHHGLGEMDIFLARVDWGQGEGKVYNLGQPVNSGGDDHYFNLKEDRSGGFFSSNRDESCCDHPYRFEIKIPYAFEEFPEYFTEVSSFQQFDSELAMLRKPFAYHELSFSKNNTEFILAEDANITGMLSEKSLPIGNRKILLVDQKGEVVSSAVTAENGQFEFRQLPAGGQYSFVLSETDTHLEVDISLLNNQGLVFGRISNADQPGLFRFKPLEDYRSGVWSLQVEDATISGRLLKDGIALVNEKILIVDERGMVVAATKTNPGGSFDFKKLPAGERYSFVLEERDVPLSIEVDVKDRLGNVIRRFNSISSREIFKYRVLEEYEAGVWSLPTNEALISGSVLTGQLVLSNKKVLLVDEYGKVIGATVTDRKGRFVFRELPAEQPYAFVLEEAEAEFNIDVAVLDNAGNIVSRFSNNNRKEIFRFRSLEDFELGVFTLEVAEAMILGKVLDRSRPVQGHTVLVMNDGIVMDKAVTDLAGDFVFTDLPASRKYSFRLEQEDRGFVISLVITDSDGNVVERMSSKNRSEIFHFEDLAIYQDQVERYHNKICGELAQTEVPMSHPIVLMDAEGSEVACVEPDHNGYFQFDDVTFDQGYRLVLDGCDTELLVKVEVDNEEGATRYRFNSLEHPEYFDYMDFARIDQIAVYQRFAVKKFPYLYYSYVKVKDRPGTVTSLKQRNSLVGCFRKRRAIIEPRRYNFV